MPHVCGEIHDELRKQDHVPRSSRRMTRKVSRARETLMRALGRLPDEEELCGHLGIDRDTPSRWLADVEVAHHIPLDRALGERERHAPIEVLKLHESAKVLELSESRVP